MTGAMASAIFVVAWLLDVEKKPRCEGRREQKGARIWPKFFGFILLIDGDGHGNLR